MDSLKAIKDACATLPKAAEAWPTELIELLAKDEYARFRQGLYFGVPEWDDAPTEMQGAFRELASKRLKLISDFFDGKLNAKTP